MVIGATLKNSLESLIDRNIHDAHEDVVESLEVEKMLNEVQERNLDHYVVYEFFKK